MVLHEFPNLDWLKKQAESNFANRQAWQGNRLPQSGWPSVILNVKASSVYRDNIRGPLSLFTNVTGNSFIEVGGNRKQVNSGFFFITNDTQHYTLEIESKATTETLNVHFGEYWLDETLRAMTASAEQLLDESVFTKPLASVELYNKLYEKNEDFEKLLLGLKSIGDQKLLEDERLFQILTALLKMNKRVKNIEESLPPLKHSTKQEILRRLHVSTDYIYANLEKNISLDDLASISCLSKFHYLRLFKQAFEKTPHQFVNEIKVKHATTLLRNTPLEIKQISKKLGFKDSSTFSRMYFSQTGNYPSQLR